MTRPNDGSIDKNPPVLYEGQQFSVTQTEQFAAWLKALRDLEGRARILKRLRRLADGHFGDCKAVGEGVSELRMFFGPGYRAYFTMVGDTVVLLLVGGDKDSQPRDIALARKLAKEVLSDGEDQDV